MIIAMKTSIRLASRPLAAQIMKNSGLNRALTYFKTYNDSERKNYF